MKNEQDTFNALQKWVITGTDKKSYSFNKEKALALFLGNIVADEVSTYYPNLPPNPLSEEALAAWNNKCIQTIYDSHITHLINNLNNGVDCGWTKTSGEAIPLSVVNFYVCKEYS